MDKKKISKLEENGWKIGDATDFLGLTREEEAFIELKVLLAEFFHEKRSERHLTQHQVASLINSSQSRVAKMEKSDPTVSLDLLFKSLFALGTSKNEIARVLSVKNRNSSTKITKVTGSRKKISRSATLRPKQTSGA